MGFLYYAKNFIIRTSNKHGLRGRTRRREKRKEKKDKDGGVQYYIMYKSIHVCLHIIVGSEQKENIKEIVFTLSLQSVLRDYMLEQNLFHKSGL